MRNQPKNSGKRSSGCVEAQSLASVLLAHPEALESHACLLFSPSTDEPVMRRRCKSPATRMNARCFAIIAIITLGA